MSIWNGTHSHWCVTSTRRNISKRRHVFLKTRGPPKRCTTLLSELRCPPAVSCRSISGAEIYGSPRIRPTMYFVYRSTSACTCSDISRDSVDSVESVTSPMGCKFCRFIHIIPFCCHALTPITVPWMFYYFGTFTSIAPVVCFPFLRIYDHRSHRLSSPMIVIVVHCLLPAATDCHRSRRLLLSFRPDCAAAQLFIIIMYHCSLWRSLLLALRASL